MRRASLEALRARPASGLIALAFGLLLGVLAGLAFASDGKPRLLAGGSGDGSGVLTTISGDGAGGYQASGANLRALERTREPLQQLVAKAQDDGDRLRVAVAPLRGGPPVIAGIDEERAWSAIKVRGVTAYLNWKRGANGPSGWSRSNAAARADIRQALVESDNEAFRRIVLEMVRAMGAAAAADAIAKTLRRGGVPSMVSSASDPQLSGSLAVGTTRWRVQDGVEFYRRLARGCLLDAPDLGQVLKLMNAAVDSQRDRVWGVNASFPRRLLYTKGGDGIDPANGKMTVEQFTVVGRGSDALVIGAMVTMAQRLPAGGLENRPLAPDVRRVFNQARRTIAGVGPVVKRLVGVPSISARPLPLRRACPSAR